MIRNIMHQMKSLRDSFLFAERTIEIFHYPGYVIRQQKERQKKGEKEKSARKNLNEKICTRTMSQLLNIRLPTKNN